MIVLNARNVHQALVKAVTMLDTYGERRESRYGPVLQSPESVTTVYAQPQERVIFHPERDANPFFHLYESIWMLAGRNDVEGVATYAKRMTEFSDDGITFYGAYGWRWRNSFRVGEGQHITDQLKIIADILKKNPDDRRCVLQMWQAAWDLGHVGKDVPCNVEATFQIGTDHKLNLSVFCRSNDIIWGCYGANAVHFSMLLEYMAHWIDVPVGIYEQISINWHAYETVFRPLMQKGGLLTDDQYLSRVWYLPMNCEGSHESLDNAIQRILQLCDNDSFDTFDWRKLEFGLWGQMVLHMMAAHQRYRDKKTLEAIGILREFPYQNTDWIAAGIQWLERRMK